MPRIALAVVAAALLVALGGCASGRVKEANAYVGKVNAAQSHFAATSDRLIAEIRPSDADARNGATLQRTYSAVDDFVAELRAIDPPARVRSLHDRLIAAIARFGTQLREAGAAIVSDDASRVLDGQQELTQARSTVSQRINRTISAINDVLSG